MKQPIFKGAAAVLLSLLLTLGASAAMPEALIPGGNTIGLQLQLDGVSVVEFSNDVPAQAGLRRGDLICKVDGTPVTTVAALSEAVASSQGRTLQLSVLRDGKEKTIKFAPTQTAEGWRLGLYVRDSITGIGTVTYYDPSDGTFGALGHGVNSGEAGELVPLRSGNALPSRVASVTRGKVGTPGALQGALCADGVCGNILQNTPQGIFGKMSPTQTPAMPLATADEVHKGAAQILSNVQGTQVRSYDIQICAVYPNDAHDRNLLIEVTDPDLLAATGGIVQGMSGSPIVQDGKLVGAVTHVLIDDPTQGYGIFIETMLNAAA